MAGVWKSCAIMALPYLQACGYLLLLLLILPSLHILIGGLYSDKCIDSHKMSANLYILTTLDYYVGSNFGAPCRIIRIDYQYL